MQNKASDKSPTATELDDSALDGVVGGGMNILGSGGLSIPGGGSFPAGGDGGSKPSSGGGGDPLKGGPSGSFDPNSVHFPK